MEGASAGVAGRIWMALALALRAGADVGADADAGVGADADTDAVVQNESGLVWSILHNHYLDNSRNPQFIRLSRPDIRGGGQGGGGKGVRGLSTSIRRVYRQFR